MGFAITLARLRTLHEHDYDRAAAASEHQVTVFLSLCVQSRNVLRKQLCVTVLSTGLEAVKAARLRPRPHHVPAHSNLATLRLCFLFLTIRTDVSIGEDDLFESFVALQPFPGVRSFRHVYSKAQPAALGRHGACLAG